MNSIHSFAVLCLAAVLLFGWEVALEAVSMKQFQNSNCFIGTAWVLEMRSSVTRTKLQSSDITIQNTQSVEQLELRRNSKWQTISNKLLHKQITIPADDFANAWIRRYTRTDTHVLLVLFHTEEVCKPRLDTSCQIEIRYEQISDTPVPYYDGFWWQTFRAYSFGGIHSKAIDIDDLFRRSHWRHTAGGC